jgi:hypothetical protein
MASYVADFNRDPLWPDLIHTPLFRRNNPMTEITKKTTTRKKTSASASAPKSIALKKNSNKVQEIRSVTREEIAALAHKFWNERGRQHGHDAEDWLRAEQTLRGKAS